MWLIPDTYLEHDTASPHPFRPEVWLRLNLKGDGTRTFGVRLFP